VPRTRRRPFVFALVLAGAAAAAPSGPLEREARAEEPKLDYADGPTACEEFERRNERELAEWSKGQPATPYAYPRQDMVLNAPWGTLLKEIGSRGELLLASFVPHAGAQLREQDVAAVVSWPWSVPFGPAFTCSRARGSFTVQKYRSHRFLLEPGVVSSIRGVGVFTRPGYRFLYHPSDWVVGAGGGLGTTIEISGNREPLRPSISPEAVIQFGHCCDSSYFTLAFRYDHYFGGGVTEIFWGSLGYTFF